MTFISPWLAMAGAAAMALPILIHLFLRRRQKPIEWAAMELLVGRCSRASVRVAWSAGCSWS